MSNIFRTSSQTVLSLMEDLKKGVIGLPDIQRPFVWKAKGVRDLIDSMYHGFPVGYLMFWENQGQPDEKYIGIDSKQSNVRFLVIDGQQRLTALYTTLTGTPIIDKNYYPKRVQVAFNPVTEDFKVANAATARDPKYLPDISEIFLATSDYSIRRNYDEKVLDKMIEREEIDSHQAEIILNRIGKVRDIFNYTFTIVEINRAVDIETVSQIFVRVNSGGVNLKQSDFVLTLLSVFWDDGRKQIEDFCKQSRTHPSISNKISKTVKPSSYNKLIGVEPDQILKPIVGYGFLRGKMEDIYNLLRGRDFETKSFRPELQDRRFRELEKATNKALNLTTWHSFVNLISSLGFKHKDLLSSHTSFYYSYAFYLLGKHNFEIKSRDLNYIIGKWYLYSNLTSRYSSSSESIFEEDLAKFRHIKTSLEFIEKINDQVEREITPDFWAASVPLLLESTSSRNPIFLIYTAALVKNNAQMLFSRKKLTEALDPDIQSTKKTFERHHIFPKNFLTKQVTNDDFLINQVANIAYTDFQDNIAISDQSPADYFPDYKSIFNKTEINQMFFHNCIPKNIQELTYTEFLDSRRFLIADYLKKYYENLTT